MLSVSVTIELSGRSNSTPRSESHAMPNDPQPVIVKAQVVDDFWVEQADGVSGD